MTTAAVQGLSREQADELRPVRIVGTVSLSHPVWRVLFVEDSAGGIYCEPGGLLKFPEPGHRVIVDGFIGNGAYLPVVNVQTVQDLGMAPSPLVATPTTAGELWNGKHDGDFVRLSGHVASARYWTNPVPLLSLELVSGGRPVVVQLLGKPPLDLDTLSCAEVEVEGVYGPRVNAEGRLTSVGLLVPHARELRIVHDSMSVLQNLPLTPISNLWSAAAPRDSELLRTRGVVQIVRSNEVSLSWGGNGIRVETPDRFSAARGEMLEIAAVPDTSGAELKLTLVRLLSREPGTLDTPIPVEIDDLFERCRYGQVVRVDGEFVHRSPGPTGELLVMREGDRSYELRIHYNPGGSLLKLAAGSRIRASGMLEIEPLGAETSPLARILVATPVDLVVLTPPPWPLQRTLAVVTGLTAALGLGLVALGLAYSRLRLSNRRVQEAKSALRDLNDDLERRIQGRTVALAASEARFRTLVEGTDVILWEYDAVTNACKYVSPQAGRLGYPLAEWTRAGFWEEQLHPDDREWVCSLSEAEIRAGRNHRMQYRLRDAKGGVVWIDDIVTTEVLADGSRIVRGVMTDITERKRVEEALMVREERLRMATEVTGCGIFDHDLVQGRLHFSPILNRMLGRAEDAPVTMEEFFDIIRPEDREPTVRSIREAHDPRGTGIYVNEHRVTMPDGEVRWLTVRGQTLFTGMGENRRAVRVTGVAIDATERRKAQLLRDEQGAVLEMIAQGAPLEKTLDRLVLAIEAQAPGILCSVLVVERDGLHLRHGAAPSLPAEYNQKVNGITIGALAGSCGTAAFRREPVVVEDLESDPLWVDFRDVAIRCGLRSCWSTPIFDAQGRLLGTFAIYSRAPGRPSEEHRQLIAISTHTAAICIKRAFDEEALQESEWTLRLSEERFAKAFHSSPALTTISSFPEGVYLDVNDEFTRLLGLTRDEVMGRTALSVGVWPKPSQRAEFIRTLEKGEPVHGMEWSMRAKSGQCYTVLGSMVRVEINSRPCLLAIAYDITRRKRIENALMALVSGTSLFPGPAYFPRLAQSLAEIFEAKCAVVAERIPGVDDRVMTLGVWLDGKVVPNFEKSLVGAPCAKAFEDGISFFTDGIQRCFPQDGLMAQLGVDSYVGITVVNGRREPIGIIALLNDTPMHPSPEVEPILRLFAESVGVEMERSRSIAALQSAEARFRSAIEHSFECVVMADSARVCTYVSPSVSRILGYSPEELLGLPMLSLVSAEDQPAVQLHFDALLRQPGAHAEIEFCASHKDGSRRWIQTSDTNRLEDANLRSIVSNFRDITAQKESEAARAKLELQLRQSQKMEAIGTLAGGIAHDFNNILGVIIGNSQLARIDIPTGTDPAECLDQVLQASQRARELVRQILTFSRREEFQRAPLQIEAVLPETLNLLRSTIPATIELSAQSGAHIPPVNGNRTLIQQVLINLATNAAQAIGARPGRVEIDVREHVVEEAQSSRRPGLSPGRYARIVVRDNGPGIETEVLDRIFEPFFTTKGPGEGTGLGLSVVHGIVKAHDGTIHVESRKGEGTTFEIYLPAAAAAPAAGSDAERGVPPSSRTHKGSGRILLVDDEAALLRVCDRMLRQSGHQVRGCLHPDEAIELFQSAPNDFDLVITDHSMPGLTGVDLAARIRRLRPNMPMLLCTGHVAGLTSEKARELGFFDIVHKPIEMEELNAVVCAALKRTVLSSGSSDPIVTSQE